MTQEELLNTYFSSQITEENLQKIILILSSFGVHCPLYPNHLYNYKYITIRRRNNGLMLRSTNYKCNISDCTRLYLKDIIKL